eukprot:Seg5393.1 transcript_id=Seg5393.1/GoldUCD/mRNA.D3Y31 product="hypothetical protein" protein_id=Seg5393.1/GoldUCD/D3Y31
METLLSQRGGSRSLEEFSNLILEKSQHERVSLLTKFANQFMSQESKTCMIVTLFDDLNGEHQEKALLDELYAKVAKTSGITSNPRDFASLPISAMLELQGANKPNLVYQWVKCILRRTDDSALHPVNRKPFGLLQYQIEFVSCTNTSQIHESDDYRKWLDTMEAEFRGDFSSSSEDQCGVGLIEFISRIPLRLKSTLHVPASAT